MEVVALEDADDPLVEGLDRLEPAGEFLGLAVLEAKFDDAVEGVDDRDGLTREAAELIVLDRRRAKLVGQALETGIFRQQLAQAGEEIGERLGRRGGIGGGRRRGRRPRAGDGFDPGRAIGRGEGCAAGAAGSGGGRSKALVELSIGGRLRLQVADGDNLDGLLIDDELVGREAARELFKR